MSVQRDFVERSRKGLVRMVQAWCVVFGELPNLQVKGTYTDAIEGTPLHLDDWYNVISIGPDTIEIDLRASGAMGNAPREDVATIRIKGPQVEYRMRLFGHWRPVYVKPVKQGTRVREARS